MNYNNFNGDISKPLLTEPGVKYFLNQTLKQCREFKNKYNNVIFNISLGIGFFLLCHLHAERLNFACHVIEFLCLIHPNSLKARFLY